MDLGPHAGFIVAAYAAAAMIVSALVFWVVIDYRGLERSIAKLEARGAKRRSDR
jgi:heme exporter protein D